MKNIQFIEPAENCSFSIHSISDEDFSLVFPQPGQDIEFVEELEGRVGRDRVGVLIQRITSRESRVSKRDAAGIHGTLFLGFPKRKQFFPTKREEDLDGPSG